VLFVRWELGRVKRWGMRHPLKGPSTDHWNRGYTFRLGPKIMRRVELFAVIREMWPWTSRLGAWRHTKSLHCLWKKEVYEGGEEWIGRGS